MGGIAGPSFVAAVDMGTVFPGARALILFRAFFQGRGFGLWLLAAALRALGERRRVVLDRAGRPGVVGPRIPARSGPDGRACSSVRARRMSSSRMPAAEGPRTDRWARCVPLGICGGCAGSRVWPIRQPGTRSSLRQRRSATFSGSRNIAPVTNSFFSPALREQTWRRLVSAAGLLPGIVALGLGSFLLNVRRFSWARFLPFAVMAAALGCGDARERGICTCVRLGAGTERTGVVPGSIRRAGPDGRRGGRSGRPVAAW